MTLLDHDKDTTDNTVDLDHVVLDVIMTRGLDRITSRLDHVSTTGPAVLWATIAKRPSHGQQQWKPAKLYSSLQATQWRNGPPSGNGPQWDRSRSQSLSPMMGRRRQKIVRFVVRWDVIPGITHRKNRPQTSHNRSGNPLPHSNARVARLATMFKYRETISGARGWARGPRRLLAQPFRTEINLDSGDVVFVAVYRIRVIISLTKRKLDERKLMGLQLPASKKGQTPQFLANVNYSQTAGWMKMPLGTEVDNWPRPHYVRRGLSINAAPRTDPHISRQSRIESGTLAIH